MKFCSKCGKEIHDEAVVCTGCGCSIESNQEYSGLATAALIFSIIGCVAQGWLIIPLAWCLPITIIFGNKVKNGEPIGIGLMICMLLFVSLIGGILALCMGESKTKK